MITRVSLLLFVCISAVFFAQCNLPTDPDKNPEFAQISKENVSSIPDTIPAGARYACTLSVVRRHMIDSIEVITEKNGNVSKLVSGKPLTDTVVFDLDFLQPANYTVSIMVFKHGLIDTLIKNVAVFSTTPVVVFQKSSYSLFYGDTSTCSLVITDPDSNLLRYSVYSNSDLIDSVNVLAIERFKKTVSLRPMTFPSLQRVNRVSVYAVDEDEQISIAQQCTITVIDTIKPVVHILAPYNDTLFTVASLPCTLTYLIQDNWTVDSLSIAGYHQNVPQNDTLKLIKTSLDSGLVSDSVEVWDRGGNSTVLRYTMVYHGMKQYPPKLKPLIIPPIFERASFDSIYLDNLVIITDTAATYTKDSLRWEIIADSTDSLIKPSYDSLRRIFYVDVRDTEIVHNRFASYRVRVTDPKGLSSETLYLQFFVIEKNDPPVITISAQSKLYKVPFDTLVLAKCAYDSDPSDKLNWTIQRGTYFKPDSIMSFGVIKKSQVLIPINPRFTGRVAIIPDTTKTSKVPGTTNIVDSLKFTVTDGELTTSKYVKFTWYRLGIIFTPDSIGMKK